MTAMLITSGRNPWRGVVVVLLAMLLSACDPFAAPESMLDEYVERVGRVLEISPQLTVVPVAPALPRLRDRVREVPAINASMGEFFGLYGCGLQHVIGERNSSLGRVMHPASRLDYELRFLIAAERCAEEVDREALVERLHEMIALKRAALTDVTWNAVWGSREIEDLFTRSRGALPVAPDQNAVGLLAHDLHSMDAMLTQIAAGQLALDVKLLEPVYQRWLGHALAGQTLRSAILLTTRLNDAAQLIEARTSGNKPLCLRQQRNRRADIMHSMFLSVYAGHVQPYLADVQRVRRALLPPLQSLARLDEEASRGSFGEFSDAVLSETSALSHWRAFDTAIARHTRAWQALLDQCGMRPGQS